MSGTVVLPSSYKPAPTTAGTAPDGAQVNEVESYRQAAASLGSQLREARNRNTVSFYVRPLENALVPSEHGDASEVVKKIRHAVLVLYRSRLESKAWRATTLQFGALLCDIGEYHLAVEVCYKPCLLAEPQTGEPIPDVEALAAHCRASMGIAMASANIAKLRDPTACAATTVPQLLLCLERIQACTQLVVSAKTPSVREALYYIVYNGAVCTLTLAEPLLTFSAAFAKLVLPFITYALMAVESTPNLATPQHLPLRVRLYGAVCRGYERLGMLAVGSIVGSSSSNAAATPAPVDPKLKAAKSGADAATPSVAASSSDALPLVDDEAVAKLGPIGVNIYAARKACARALKGIAALRRMYLADPPVLESDISAIDGGMVDMLLRRFRYDCYLSVSAATQALTKDVPSMPGRLAGMVSALTWGHGEVRRVLRHSPPGFEAQRVLDDAAVNSVARDGVPSQHSVTSEAVSAAEIKRVSGLVGAIMKELKPLLESGLPVLKAYLPTAFERVSQSFLLGMRESSLHQGGVAAAAGAPRSAMKKDRDIPAYSGPSLEEALSSFEASPAAAALPLHLHVALLRLLFSHECWSEFCFLLHLAEARYDGLLPSLAHNAASITSESREMIVLGHELLLMRRFYELEYGILQASIDIPASASVSSIPGAGAAGVGSPPGSASSSSKPGKPDPKAAASAAAPKTAGAATPGKAGKGGLEEEKKDEGVSSAESGPVLPSSISPLAAALAAGHSAAQPLPFVKVTPVQLSCAAEALMACTRTVQRLDGGVTASHPALTAPVGGASLCVSRPDLVRDAVMILAEHVLALQACKDSRDIGLERGASQKNAINDVLMVSLRALHIAAARVPLDDPLLRGTLGLRLAALCAERNDLVQAVQVVRAAMATVQAGRDRQLSLAPRLPSYAAGEADDADRSVLVRDSDLLTLAHASVTTTSPPPELLSAVKRANSDAAAAAADDAGSSTPTDQNLPYSRSFGAASVTWTAQASLASLHADLVSLWAILELRYAAWDSQQAAIVSVKRKRMAAAKAAQAAQRQRNKIEKLKGRSNHDEDLSDRNAGTVRIDAKATAIGAGMSADGAQGAADNDDYAEYLREAFKEQGPKFQGWAPSHVAEQRLLSECKHNSAWKALVHLASLNWKYDTTSRYHAIQAAFDHLEAAVDQEKQAVRSVVGSIRKLFGQNRDGSSMAMSETGRNFSGAASDSTQAAITIQQGTDPRASMSRDLNGRPTVFGRSRQASVEGKDGASRSPSPDRRVQVSSSAGGGLIGTASLSVRGGIQGAGSTAGSSRRTAGKAPPPGTATHKYAGKTIVLDPKTGLPLDLQTVKAYKAPFILCRNSSSITVAPITYPGSDGGVPVPTTRGKPAAPVIHYSVYGKPFGASTDVAETNTDLQGTGVPVHLATSGGAGSINDGWASTTAPADVAAFAVRAVPAVDKHGRAAAAGEDPDASDVLARSLSVTVTSLAPNDLYSFAAGAVTSSGLLAGDSVSASTPPVLAATPLPLHLLWGYLAMEAHKIGEHRIARTAALKVVTDYVSTGPLRPLWTERPNPAAMYTLRRDVLALAPRPVAVVLVRALCILAETSETGLPPQRKAPVPAASAAGASEEFLDPELAEQDAAGAESKSIVPPVSILDADGWTFDSLVDGRSAEGPGAPDETASLNSMPYGARLQIAALQRVGTLCVAVEAATALKDPYLMQLAASSCCTAMLPILATGTQPTPHLLQPLLLCYQALNIIPHDTLQPLAARTFSRITYELTLACLHAGPMLSPPGVVRDTAYARAVITTASASDEAVPSPTALLLQDTTSAIAPQRPNPSAVRQFIGTGFQPMRDYSPWLTETDAADPYGTLQNGLVPPPALATAYGLFATTYGQAAAGDVAQKMVTGKPPFGHGASGLESERVALAHFLLWSPRWAEMLDSMGVNLSASSAVAPAAATAGAAAAAGSSADSALVQLVGAVSGLAAVTSDTNSSSDPVSSALASLHKQEEANVRAMAEVWAAARSDPIAALDLVFKKYCTLEPASAPPSTAPAAAKGGKPDPKAAASAAPEAPKQPLAFHPLFVQLICRVVGTALVARLYSPSLQDGGGNASGLPASLMTAIDGLTDKLRGYLNARPGSSSSGLPMLDVSASKERFLSILSVAKVDGFPEASAGLPSSLDGVSSSAASLALFLCALRPLVAAALMPSPSTPSPASASSEQKDGDNENGASGARDDADVEFARLRAASFFADMMSLTKLDTDVIPAEADVSASLDAGSIDGSLGSVNGGNTVAFGLNSPVAGMTSPMNRRQQAAVGDDVGNITTGRSGQAGNAEGSSASWQMLRQADTAAAGSAAMRLPLLWMAHFDLLRAKGYYSRLLDVAQVQSALELSGTSPSAPVASVVGADRPSTVSFAPGVASSRTTAEGLMLAWRQASTLLAATAAAAAGSPSSPAVGQYEGSGPYSFYPHLTLLLEPNEQESSSSLEREPFKAEAQLPYVSSPANVPAGPDALSNSLTLLRFLLAAASDSAVEARAALAWSTVRDAAKTAWAGIGSAWASPHWFGVTEGVFSDSFESVPARGDASGVVFPPSPKAAAAAASSPKGSPARSAASPGGSDDEGSSDELSASGSSGVRAAGSDPANTAWRVVPELEPVVPPTRTVALDWRPLWRIALCLLDMVDSVSQGKIERLWGRGLLPQFGSDNQFANADGDGVDIASDDGIEADAGSGKPRASKSVMLTQKDSFVMGGTSISGGAGNLQEDTSQEPGDGDEDQGDDDDGSAPVRPPPGMSLDDLAWVCRFLSYTSLALLHAQEWSMLAAFAGRVADAHQVVVKMLGGRDMVSQSPLPSTPDQGWSGVGGGLVLAPVLAVSEQQLSGGGNGKNEPSGFTLYPGYFSDRIAERLSDLAHATIHSTRGHGAAIADDALATVERVGMYAARIRWTAASNNLDAAKGQLHSATSAFENRPSLRMKMRRKKASIAEQQALIAAEEREFAVVRATLQERIDRYSAVAASKASTLRRLEDASAHHLRDMSAPRKQLTRARTLLVKHLHFGVAAGKDRAVLPFASQAVLPADLAQRTAPSAGVGASVEITTGAGGSTLAAIRKLRGADATAVTSPALAAGVTNQVVVAVPFNAVVSAYSAGVTAFRTRRDTALMCQALHELGTLHWTKAGALLSQGDESGLAQAALHVRYAFDAWKDGLDAAFGTLDVHLSWRSVVARYASTNSNEREGKRGSKHAESGVPGSTSAASSWQSMGTGLFEKHGFAGCVLPAILACKVAVAAQSAAALLSKIDPQPTSKAASDAPPQPVGAGAAGIRGAVLSQAEILDLHLLSAFCISATFTASAILHPTRDVDFSRHRATVWVPGIDILADERLISSTSLQFVLRATITSLLEYGSAFAERTLPLACAYEHLAVSRFGDVRVTVDARLLRARAQVAVGDIEGAVDTLSGILRADGLPNAGVALPSALAAALGKGSAATNTVAPPVATAAAADPKKAPPTAGGKGAPTAAAPAPAPSSSSPSEASFAFATAHHATLPRLYNHLPPIHPVNRAAMSWLANPDAVQMPAGLSALLGPVLAARIQLLRAEICRSILAASKCTRAHIDFFGELGVGPDLEHPNSWYGSMVASSQSSMLNKGAAQFQAAAASASSGITSASGAGRSAVQVGDETSGLYSIRSLYYGLTKEQLRWPMMQSGSAGAPASAAPEQAKPAGAKPGTASGKSGKDSAPAPTAPDAGSTVDDATAVAGDATWIEALARGARAHISAALKAVDGEAAVQMEALGLARKEPAASSAAAAATLTGTSKPGSASSATGASKPGSPGKPATASAASAASSPDARVGEAVPLLADTAITAVDSGNDSSGTAVVIACAVECSLLAHARGELRVTSAASAAALKLMATLADPMSFGVTSARSAAFIGADIATLTRMLDRSINDAFAPRFGVPSWLAMRQVAVAALLASGSIGEADSVVTAALKEARFAGDHVNMDRLLLLQAAAATLLGETNLAFDSLAAIAGPALAIASTSELVACDTSAFAASRAYAIMSLKEASTVSKALNCLISLQRTMGRFTPSHGIGTSSLPRTRLLKLLASSGLGSGTDDGSAAELRLLFLSERLIRQRLGALGVDVRRMDLAADTILRVEGPLDTIIDSAQPTFTLDSVYTPDMEVLGEVRDMIGDALIGAAVNLDSAIAIASSSPRPMTVTAAGASLAAIAARKRAQQLVVCHHISAVQPSMIACASLGIARAVRIWLASSAHTVSLSTRSQLMQAAELHAMVGFEVCRILCEHDTNLLRFAAVELTLQYLFATRSSLREDERVDSGSSSAAEGFQATEAQDRGLRYSVMMHRLAGRLGVVSQRALAGKASEFVARESAAPVSDASAAAASGKDAKAPSRPATTSAAAPPTASSPGASAATVDDAKLRSILPASLFDDLLAYRKANSASAAEVHRAALMSNDPALQPPQGSASTSAASILYSHMTGLYQLMRAWPSPSGPLAATIEDAAQSLHSALCSLVPSYRSAWGLGRSLQARTTAATKPAESQPLTIKPAPGGATGSGSLRFAFPHSEDASTFSMKGLSASILTRNDEDITDGSTVMMSLCLGPVAASPAAPSPATSTTGGSDGHVDGGRCPSASASSSDCFILRVEVPSHALLALREQLCDVRRRYQQMLDPAAIAATQLLVGAAAPASSSAPVHAQLAIGGDTPAAAAQTLTHLSAQLALLLRSSGSSRQDIGALPDLLTMAASMKAAASSPTAAPAAAAGAAKPGTAAGSSRPADKSAPAPAAAGKAGPSARPGDAPSSTQPAETDCGDASDDEDAASSSDAPSDDAAGVVVPPAHALKLTDAICKLLDHRFGGSSKQGAVNAWLRECLL